MGGPIGTLQGVNEPFDRVRRLGIAIWTGVGLAILLAITAWLLVQVKIIWMPVIFATAIVYILNPLVTRLRSWGLPRVLGAAVAYLVVGGLGTMVVVLLLPTVTQQANALTDQLPTIYDDSIAGIQTLAANLGLGGVELLTYQELVDRVSSPDQNFQDSLQELASTVFSFALDFVEIVAVFIITPVIGFYLLVDVPKLQTKGTALVPVQYRDEAIKVGSNLGRAFGGFVRGQLFVASIVAILSSIGLYLLGFELWLIMGIVAGLLNLVPFIGPWVSGFLAVTVALVLGDFAMAAGVAMLFLGVQQLDNQIISPLVLRATVQLHPTLIISALLVGSSIGGLVGLVIAVPVTALGKVLLAHFWRTRVLGESWEDASDAFLKQYEPPSPDSMAGRLRRVGRMQLSEPAVRHHGDDLSGAIEEARAARGSAPEADAAGD